MAGEGFRPVPLGASRVVCDRCGAYVVDEKAHDEFHRLLGAAYAEVLRLTAVTTNPTTEGSRCS